MTAETENIIRGGGKTMAILMIQDASEDTRASYDEVIKLLEAAGQGHPAGRQFHVAARKGNGYLVTDVWESQEALDRFFLCRQN